MACVNTLFVQLAERLSAVLRAPRLRALHLPPPTGIDALSQQLVTRAGWEPPATGDSLGAITPRPGDHIAMVGLLWRCCR